MGFKEDNVRENLQHRLECVLKQEIADAEYSNKPTGELKSIRDQIKTGCTEDGNLRHFED